MMEFIQYIHEENAENFMCFNKSKHQEQEMPGFQTRYFTHETIPLNCLYFLFNTDTDSHYYVRQILFHRLNNQTLSATEDNKPILLEIVPDYFTTDVFPADILANHFNVMQNSCRSLIRTFYDLLVSFIRVKDNSLLYNYYEDITRLRNIETSEILNVFYAFYENEIDAIYYPYIIKDYVTKYYKVRVDIFTKVVAQHTNTDIASMLDSPAIADYLKYSTYVKSNNPVLVEYKNTKNISDSLFNSLFIDTFELQKQYV